MPYLSTSEVVFHEEALYQVYAPLPLPSLKTTLTPLASIDNTAATTSGWTKTELCMYVCMYVCIYVVKMQADQIVGRQ